MTTRRIISDEKTILDKDDMDIAPSASQVSDTAASVPRHVIIKLLAFSFAMITAPISTYFLTVNSIFGGNPTYAGATAAVTANVVLMAYVYVAMTEDAGETDTSGKAKKGDKDQ